MNVFDVVVLGAGPGGYVAAIKAAQLGARVALIEESHMGGTCLNVGCIPTKTLLAGAEIFHKMKTASEFGIQVEGLRFNYAQMKARKDNIVSQIRSSLEGLIQSNQITIIKGRGKFDNAHCIKIEDNGKYQTIEAKNVIIATGSRPNVFSPFTYDGKRVHHSTSILEITTLPKHLAIVGGGYIGCEFASLFSELGVQITLIEAFDHLVANECKESRQLLESSFEKRGIRVLKKTKIKEQTLTENGVKLHLEDGSCIEADSLLVAVGRLFNSENLGLERVGVSVDSRGAISVDEKMQTNIPHIYAIGDVTGKWLLAHCASHGGLVAASNACGQASKMDYSAVPAVIFTHPEIASVGYTLEKALEKDHAKTEVTKISQLGLVEMTRARTGKTIQSMSFETCPYCSGRGQLKIG
jgi:dihydrolipoamide dehydrogenase